MGKSVAYRQGHSAVTDRPEYAPTNPYDSETQPDQWAEWDDGAYNAGITGIYVNGIRWDLWEKMQRNRKA